MRSKHHKALTAPDGRPTRVVPGAIELAQRAYAEEHDEDPSHPETVQAMQLVLNLPKHFAEMPKRSSMLAAAGVAVAKVCLESGAHKELEKWYEHLPRKITRRARGAKWDHAHEVPGADATVDDASARALVPGRADRVPTQIALLQVKGTEIPHDGADLNDADPDIPIVLVDDSLGMSAGKAAAQVGHGVMALVGAMPAEWTLTWAADGYPLQVREVDSDTFELARMRDDAAEVVDKGFTEIPPDSVTVVGLPHLRD